MALELFSNPPTPGVTNVPWVVATLTQSITTAPASGTVETWGVNQSAPTALRSSSSAQFRVVIDSEIMIVAASTSGASPWSFTRGAEGTTPAPHSTNAPIYHVLTAGAMNNIASSGSLTGALLAANNLSDVANVSTSRTSLGLNSGATAAISSSAGDFQPDGTAVAGATGRVADAGHVHPTDTSRAPLASPSLTGVPSAPTPVVDDSSTRLATTAYVEGQVSSTPPAMDGSAAVGTSARFARSDHVHPSDTSRAPLASPTFTGTPSAPTATVGTNTTQLATTAFVLANGGALTPTAVQSTGTYVAAVGDLVLVDLSTASIAITLPNAPADRSQVGWKIVAFATGHTLTINRSGSDVFNVTGGATSQTGQVLDQAKVYQYQHSTAIWLAVEGDNSLAQLDARYDASGAASGAISALIAANDPLGDRAFASDLMIAMTTGAIPSAIPTFIATHAYPQYTVIQQSGAIYFATIAFTSGASFSSSNWTQLTLPSSGGGSSLAPSSNSTVTGAQSPAPGMYVPFSLSSVNGTLNLPNAPADKSLSGYKVEAFATGKTLTVVTQGADTFDTGGTSATPPVGQGAAKFYQYNATTKVWTALYGDTPITLLDGRYDVLGAALGTRNGVGDGPPTTWYPPSPTLVLPWRQLGRRVGILPDDTFDFRGTTEEDVMRANGQFGILGAPNWGFSEGAKMPSLYRSHGITWVRPSSTTNQNCVLLPLGGLVAADEWTMQVFVRPRGTDIQTISTQGGFSHYSFVFFGVNPQIQYFDLNFQAGSATAGTYTLQALIKYWDFTSAATAQFISICNNTLLPGDFPADTVCPITVSFDTTNGLQLTAGVNNKLGTNGNTGSPVASRLLSWDGDGFSGGALQIPASPSTFDKGIDISVPVFGRYSNNVTLYGPDAGASAGSGTSPGANYRYRPRPKLTLNAQAGGTTWRPHIGGLTMAAEQAYILNNTGSFQALAAAGCPAIRLAETDDQATYSTNWAIISNLATLTASSAAQRAIGGGGTVGGTAIGINWANFDQSVLNILNAGIDINTMIGYVPTALQTAASRHRMPTSPANFALWASAIYGRYKWLETQATGSGRMIDCTFWNEPELEWLDTQANFVSLYITTTQQINADQAANGNSGAWLSTSDHISQTSGWDPTAPNMPYLSALLVAANAATPRPAIPAVHWHDYNANFEKLHTGARMVANLCAANGYTGIPERISEYESSAVVQAAFPNGAGPQAGVERTSDVFQAVATYATIVEMLNEGLDLMSFFQSHDIFTTGWNGGQYGALFDSNANSAQPNGDGSTGTGKPTMVFNMFEMLWKHHAGLTGVQSRLIAIPAHGSTWPNLRGILTTGTNVNGKTVVVLTYGSYRHAGGTPTDKCRVDFEWTLPVGMTVASWKQWSMSDSVRGPGRLPIKAQDIGATAPATLPISDLIDWESVNCIQVTST